MSSHVFESAARFEPEHAGVLVLCCSDGRFREAVDDFLHEHLGLSRYDRLVIPGGPGAIAGGGGTWRQEESVLEDLRFAIQAHHTDMVVLISHEDCGFYSARLGVRGPDQGRRQREDLRKVRTRVGLLGPGLRVEAFHASAGAGKVRFEAVEE